MCVYGSVERNCNIIIFIFIVIMYECCESVLLLTQKCMPTSDDEMIYRIIHKCLRDFRPLRYSSRDGHAEGEHVNRGILQTWRDSLPIDMLLFAVSVLVVAQPSSEVPEGLMNYPV